MPKISVIVPVYNVEHYLTACLESLVHQTFSDIEILLINDGSTDNSPAIMEEYAARYPDKIRCEHQENRGQAAARNRGISLATGEFIAFTDSDDYLDLTTFEKTVALAQAQELDIVCFGMMQVKNGELTEDKYRQFTDLPVHTSYILNEASPANKLIRRTLLTDNGLRFLEGYIYEDLELVPQLALYTEKIGYLDEPLYYYVIHGDSTMRQKRYNPKLASIYHVMDSLYEKFSAPRYAAEREYLFIEHLMHGAMLRYLDYAEGDDDVRKIADIMRRQFPKWWKNRYFAMWDVKRKLVCYLVYAKQVWLLRRLLHKAV